jgi:hypothetical protein
MWGRSASDGKRRGFSHAHAGVHHDAPPISRSALANSASNQETKRSGEENIFTLLAHENAQRHPPTTFFVTV